MQLSNLSISLSNGVTNACMKICIEGKWDMGFPFLMFINRHDEQVMTNCWQHSSSSDNATSWHTGLFSTFYLKHNRNAWDDIFSSTGLSQLLLHSSVITGCQNHQNLTLSVYRVDSFIFSAFFLICWHKLRLPGLCIYVAKY